MINYKRIELKLLILDENKIINIIPNPLLCRINIKNKINSDDN